MEPVPSKRSVPPVLPLPSTMSVPKFVSVIPSAIVSTDGAWMRTVTPVPMTILFTVVAMVLPKTALPITMKVVPGMVMVGAGTPVPYAVSQLDGTAASPLVK